MKTLFISLIIILLSVNIASAGTMVLEGKYQSKNLYVLNGQMENGVGFCTYEVSINGEVTTDEVNSSSFEIDFSQFAIKYGEHVIVKIKHKDDCCPKVINPEVLQAHATFEVTDINIDKSGILNWSTKNENGSLPYIIEQFRWHKWIEIGEVTGRGALDKNTYSFKLLLHSAENKIRVRQEGYGGITKKSSVVSFVSAVTEPTYVMSRDAQKIDFSDETLYEIYDAYGQILKKGYGKSVDIANLVKGAYYLCYDNQIAEFKKKGRPLYQ